MKTTADYIVSGFAKIDADLNYLMKCLQEVLVELGETEGTEFLPWQEGGQTHNIDDPPPRIEGVFDRLSIVELLKRTLQPRQGDCGKLNTA